MGLNLKHKFGAKQTEVRGIKFPSKMEARYYIQLLRLKKEGQILFFLRQVGFDLPGGYRHFVDFLVFWANGEAEFIEVKGKDLKVGKMKREQVEDLYNIKITVISKV